MVTIKTVTGGWIIEYPCDFADSLIETTVVETQDGETEAESFIRVLWVINHEIGPSTSRYSSQRIHITMEPGDKYED